MGHHTEFGYVGASDYLKGKSDREIFNAAVDASDSYRSDIRFGTMRRLRVMTKDEVFNRIDHDPVTGYSTYSVGGLMDEYCYLIPVADKSDVVTKTGKLKLAVSGEVVRQLRANDYRGIHAVRALVQKHVGDTFISNMKVVKLPAPRKFTAKVTEGKMVTVYEVWAMTYEEHGNQIGEPKASQAEARAFALKCAERNANEGREVLRWEVRPVMQREDGNRVSVVISRPVVDSNIEVEYTTESAKPTAKIAGYYAAFDVHT